MDEKDILIEALKAANKGRGIVICKLIKDGIKKDNEIKSLKDRIEFLEKWIRWNERE